MGDSTRKIYAAEDAAEGCWMEAKEPLARYRTTRSVYVKCGGCGEAWEDPEPWEQCGFCGALIPPEDDE